MLETILMMAVCTALSAALAGAAVMFCAKKNFFLHQYNFRYDPFIYLFAILCFGTFCAVGFVPDARDAIVDPSVLKCAYGFVVGLGLYVYSLFDEKKLFKLLIVVASLVGAFLSISSDAVMIVHVIPPFVFTLLCGVVMALFALSCGVLSRLLGVFETVISVMLFGVILLFAVHGLPFYIALAACVWLGVWVVLRQMNIAQNTSLLASNGCIVTAFVFAMTFVTVGVNELCVSSMMILMTYPFCEWVVALVMIDILKRTPAVLSEQTIYFRAFEKGLPQETLYVALLKLNILNVMLAGFQLFSPNALTLPLIAIALDGWLMKKLYYFDEPDLTLKAANAQVVDNVKKSIHDARKKMD